MRHWLGRSAPIGVQVVLLLVVSVLVAQAVSIALVLMLPRPELVRHRPDRVAALLTGTEQSADFVLTRRDEPPEDDYIDQDERAFAEALAARLNVPVQRVRAVLISAPPGEGRPKGPGMPVFTAARQLDDGGWQWLEEERGWLDEWQKRALLWLALSALLIAPAGLLFARRFIRPVRAFAASAERIGLDPQAEVMMVKGPAEIEEAAEAFRLMQGRIAHYVEERTGMVAAIAHDLRTPLTRLAFRLEALPETQRDAAMRDIDEMQRMIGAALDYVKGAARMGEQVPVALGEVVTRTIESLAHEGAAVAVEIEAAPLVSGDAAMLERLLSNLVINALRYGGGAVRVVLDETEGRALVSVEDDGPGIPEAELERVFDPFYRLEPSRSRASGGTGLGLSIARSIAGAHGGTLVLANRDRGGLRALVTLPLAGAG